MDQFLQHGGAEEFPTTPQGMRNLLCDSFLDIEELHELILKEGQQEESKEEYYKRMIKNGEYGDHIMLKTAATVFERNIIVYPVFPNPFWDLPFKPCPPSQAIHPDFTLLHYDDTNFITPHYRSIIANPNNPVQQPPRNSTVVASPSNLSQVHEPQCSPVLQPQSNQRNLEDTYDMMCGGIQEPVSTRDHEPAPNNVEVACGTKTQGM